MCPRDRHNLNLGMPGELWTAEDLSEASNKRSPVSRLLAGILLQHTTGPQLQHLTEKKEKKNQTFSKPQNNCGMFFRTSFCTVQQRHITLRVYLKVRSYYYQPTDWGKSKPHTQNPRDLHVKNERLTSRLYHHPGCFPLDTFQLVNVQKTWLPDGLICTEDLLPVLILPWLFRVKLFSLNVK